MFLISLPWGYIWQLTGSVVVWVYNGMTWASIFCSNAQQGNRSVFSKMWRWPAVTCRECCKVLMCSWLHNPNWNQKHVLLCCMLGLFRHVLYMQQQGHTAQTMMVTRTKKIKVPARPMMIGMMWMGPACLVKKPRKKAHLTNKASTFLHRYV